MEIEFPSRDFQRMSIEHNLTEVDVPSTVAIHNDLGSSVILAPSYSNMLLPTLDRFCRVCGNEAEPKDLVPIFTDKGLQLDIPKKISTHLQIQVLQNDGLPQQVCLSCICQLNICQQLVQVSQEADIKLHHIFQAVEKTKQISTKILDENSFQEVEHKTSSLKDSHADNLRISTNRMQGIKIVLMEKDLIKENKQEEIVMMKSNLINENILLMENNLVDENKQEEIDTTKSDLAKQNKEENVLLIENDIVEENKKSKGVPEEKNDLVEDSQKNPHQGFVNEVIVSPTESCESITHRNKDVKKENIFLCDLCGKHFHQATNLRIHKRTHLPDSLKKKHPCTLCTKKFRSEFFLSEHMNTHNGFQPYSCPDCDKKFHKKIQLRQHHKTHMSDSQKLACEICGMKFNRRGNLTQHIKTHSQDRKYVCRVCKEEFTSLNTLLSHRRIHTQEDIKKRIMQGETKEDNFYTCEICGKILFKKSSFAYHLRTHIGPADLEGKKWKCKLCGKVLATRASLNYHTKSQHSNERPWRCQFCAEGFMLKELLLTHERIHTGEKPYICSICRKSFRAPSNLTQHMLMHNENRNFECPYCNKRFHRRGTLNVHTRTHTGERPFICDLCGRPFTQKNDMLKHQKTHGLQPQHSCDVCSLSFNFKKDLTKHKLLSHRGDLETDVVPVIFTSDNSVFSNITHILTEDGKKILLSTVQSFEETHDVH